MPKENIERAIKKGSGADAESYFETTYEGYGPNGVAVFVECTTDNLNRTVSSVRSTFSKYGGSLGVNGSVEYMFDRKGNFLLHMPEDADRDELTLELIDGGAEEVDFDEDLIAVTCTLEDFGNMQSKIDEMNLNVENAELNRIPSNYVNLDDDDFVKVMKLIDVLEDDDDIQKVYHNLEVTEEKMALL